MRGQAIQRVLQRRYQNESIKVLCIASKLFCFEPTIHFEFMDWILIGCVPPRELDDVIIVSRNSKNTVLIMI